METLKFYLFELNQNLKLTRTNKQKQNLFYMHWKNMFIGNPIVKHIEGNLWELRPLKNRIFFFY